MKNNSINCVRANNGVATSGRNAARMLAKAVTAFVLAIVIAIGGSNIGLLNKAGNGVMAVRAESETIRIIHTNGHDMDWGRAQFERMERSAQNAHDRGLVRERTRLGIHFEGRIYEPVDFFNNYVNRSMTFRAISSSGAFMELELVNSGAVPTTTPTPAPAATPTPQPTSTPVQAPTATPRPAATSAPQPAATPTPEIVIVRGGPPVIGADGVAPPVVFDSPTLLSNDDLLAWIEIAPSLSDTRSATNFSDRLTEREREIAEGFRYNYNGLSNPLGHHRLSDAELEDWINEYRELGGINARELEVVRLINEIRAGYGLDPLAICTKLSMAARFHSQEMTDLRYFSHESPITRSAISRARMFGHPGAGENATTRGNPSDIVQAWMNSLGHRRPLVDPRMTHIGVGIVGRTTAKWSSNS